MNEYADLLIIGAGPAGMAAALAAAPSGARIVMLDDNPLAGGKSGATVHRPACQSRPAGCASVCSPTVTSAITPAPG